GTSLGWRAQRSLRRFFWRRQVIIGFGEGSAVYALEASLRDLQHDPPALGVLQKIDWHVGEPNLPNSAEFFLSDPQLHAWLEAGYVLDRETPMFAVWRRRG